MRTVIVGVLGIALAVAAGCARTSDREGAPGHATRTPDPVSDTVGDPGAPDAINHALMVSLAQAKNFHHKAKVFMTDGNPSAAIASVRQILSLPFPRGAAEADDVRNDARALLAKLWLSQGQLDEAARVIDEGLAPSQRESFFVANLYTVEGEIHEARAAAADATGEAGKATARDERRRAIDAYDRSIRINERLQKQLMEER